MDFTSHVARVLSPYAPQRTHDSAMTMSLYRPFRSIRRSIQNTPTIPVFHTRYSRAHNFRFAATERKRSSYGI